MEDPRIISALFIFLKMAYYNVLINSSSTVRRLHEIKKRMEFTLYCVNVQSKLWSTGRIGKILFRTFRDRVGERSIQIALDRNGNAKRSSCRRLV